MVRRHTFEVPAYYVMQWRVAAEGHRQGRIKHFDLLHVVWVRVFFFSVDIQLNIEMFQDVHVLAFIGVL